jgi:hypothetical protein
MVSTPMRILIDWDRGANGIWVIRSNGTTCALFLPKRLARWTPGGELPRPVASSHDLTGGKRLSPDLRTGLLASGRG